MQKAVLPKIFSTLSKGCNGNASLICPYMLPFLSVLPEDFVGTSGTTYVTFFTSLREGYEFLMDVCFHRSMLTLLFVFL